jgi:hypothetical protein
MQSTVITGDILNNAFNASAFILLLFSSPRLIPLIADKRWAEIQLERNHWALTTNNYGIPSAGYESPQRLISI